MWRRDLRTGAVEQVAGGDAELPSISENGRYISFTTNEGGKLAQVTNGQAVSSGALTHEAPTCTCATWQSRPANPARSSSRRRRVAPIEPLTYRRTERTLRLGRERALGDQRRRALRRVRDDRRVGSGADRKRPARRGKKRTAPRGNARAPGRRARPADKRDEARQRRIRTTAPPNGPCPRRTEAWAPSTKSRAFTPARPSSTPPSSSQGASISADGSTVAWIGQEIDKQAPVLAGAEASPEYVEPLWRRIAGGASEPTRRITGGADPANPACAASGETQPISPPTLSDPCQGPFEPSLPGDENGPPGVFTLEERHHAPAPAERERPHRRLPREPATDRRRRRIPTPWPPTTSTSSTWPTGSRACRRCDG